MAKKGSSKADFLAALVRTGYFPEELPPVITTRYFSEFCKREYKTLKSSQSLKRVTKYDTFTAPRVTSGRRNLAIVNPISQLNLSLLITDHRQQIKSLISRSGRSLYLVSEDIPNGRAFKGLDFRRRDVSNEEIRSEYPFILTTDISRYFYTVYTHSIPWAIIGKEKAKNWLLHHRVKLKKHWSNKLDEALQACQSKETFGIPVGPDTSRIIAELIFGGIENDPTFSSSTHGRKSCRLVDDLVIGFEDETSAIKALGAIRTALWKFNLQLNDEKTKISSSRMPAQERWEHVFDNLSTVDKDTARQEREIYRLIDFTLHCCQEARSERPATWACKRLLRLKNIDRNFAIILNALLRFSRDFPSCIPHAAEFLINNKRRCDEPDLRKKIRDWAERTIRANLEHSHDAEVAWALIVSGVLGIKVRANAFVFTLQPSAVVFAILGLLKEKDLLEFSLAKWPWRALFRKDGLNGPHWLPLYEAVLRNWTGDKKLVAMVKADPIFSKMLTEKVTFLEDGFLNVAKLDVSRRVFRPRKAKVAASIQTSPSQVSVRKSWAGVFKSLAFRGTRYS